MHPPTSLAALAVGLALLAAPAARAAGAPQITSTWTTAVSATSADLRAEVDAEGIATSYRFEYIAEALYRENLNLGHEAFAGAARLPSGAEATLGSASADTEAAQHVGNLKAATAYRYRVLATNAAAETATGPTLTFTTSAAGSGSALPDHRGWELVSPLEKNGGQVQGPGEIDGGGVLQAAPGGESIAYSSTASFGEGAQGAPPASQYLSTRAQSGWITANITQPTLSGAYGDNPDGVPYQLFSTDLARGLLLNGRRCAAGEQCPRSYSLRDDEDGALASSPAEPDLRFAGASPDLHHIVLSTCAALTPEATEQPVCGSGGPNLYEWSEGALRLINLLEGDAHGTSDAHLAAQSGAISTDGSRVYFTVGEDAELFLHEGESGARPVSLAPAVKFQTATPDGSVAFYTKGEDLYRYLAQADSSELLAEGVKGVLGASEEGSRVYYLTSAGLFLWTAPDTTTEVASGAPAAFAGDYPPTTGTARVSADGTRLAFLSKASLTGYDNTDQSTGEPDAEVYLYQAPPGSGGGGTLTCASCNPTGQRPLGPSTIPGAIANGAGEGAADSYKPRDLSADGRRLFFDSEDSLVPQDTDAAPDVYEWEAPGAGTCLKPAGCLNLISGGRSEGGASFIDASASGSDAFFLTAASLIPSDPGSADLYDARENGGFPEPPPPIECDGDACQSLPPEPEDPAPGTLVPGQGNPPVHFPKQHHHKPNKHRKRRHHKRGGHR